MGGKTVVMLFALMAIFGGLVFAQDDSIVQGRALVEARVSCANLTAAQLETIGDYLMEQMHPGKAHEYMDNVMGGEGSQSLRNAHIQMAQSLYCGNASTPLTYGGMMGMMPMMMGGFYGGGVMGRGMMGYGGGLPGYSFMGYGYPALFGWNLTDVLVAILLVGLIILVYGYVWKMLKQSKEKK